MMTLEQIIEREQSKRTEGGQFGISACKESIQFYLEHGSTLEQLLDEYVKRANEDVFFNKAMVLACWEMLEEAKAAEAESELYIVQNIFGMIRCSHDLAAAEEAYFDEVAFCGCAELKNAYTGEILRSSY